MQEAQAQPPRQSDVRDLGESRASRRPQPQSQPPSVADVDRDLSKVEEIQKQRAERGRRLGHREFLIEADYLHGIRRGIERLQAQVDAGTLEGDQVADLNRADLNSRYQKAIDQVDSEQKYWQQYPRTIIPIRVPIVLAEGSLNDAYVARLEGRSRPQDQRGWEVEQGWLDHARDAIAGHPPAERDTAEFEWLRELERKLGELQRRLDFERNNPGNAMSTVDPNIVTPGHAQGRRPVVVPPPPASGGSTPPFGIPATVTVAERLLDTLDPYGDQPGEVAKPIPPSLPTPDKDVNPGLWARLNEKFEHAPKPDPTTTTIGALGLSAATAYALSRTWIGQLILLFSTVPENSLKGIPPTISGAATPG